MWVQQRRTIAIQSIPLTIIIGFDSFPKEKEIERKSRRLWIKVTLNDVFLVHSNEEQCWQICLISLQLWLAFESWLCFLNGQARSRIEICKSSFSKQASAQVLDYVELDIQFYFFIYKSNSSLLNISEDLSYVAQKLSVYSSKYFGIPFPKKLRSLGYGKELSSLNQAKS